MESNLYLLFTVDSSYFALPVSQVERVLPAAEVTPIQDVPDYLLGLINLGGSLLPVLDMRRFMDFKPQELLPHHHFILTKSLERYLLLRVDQVEEVIELPLQPIDLPGDSLKSLQAEVSTVEGRIILIKDVASFIDSVLSLVEGKKGGEGGEGPLYRSCST